MKHEITLDDNFGQLFDPPSHTRRAQQKTRWLPGTQLKMTPEMHARRHASHKANRGTLDWGALSNVRLHNHREPVLELEIFPTHGGAIPRQVIPQLARDTAVNRRLLRQPC